MRFAWFSLALMASACASTPPAPDRAARPESAAIYAPLELGLRWTYAVSYPGQKGEMTVEIAEKSEDGYWLDNRGGQFRHTTEGLRDRTRYLIRTPLRVGHKWKSVVSASAIEHYEILSVGEPCEAKAGRFEDCLVVQSRLRRDDKVTLRVRWTWVRGIGLAALETEADIAGQGVVPQTSHSLLSYSRGPDRAPGGSAPRPEDMPEPEKVDSEGAPDTWEQ